MKKLILIGSMIIYLIGCQSLTDLTYGPDLTPGQLKDVVYEDAYALGTLRAINDSDDINGILKRAKKAKASTDPMSTISEMYYNELRKGEIENAIIWFAARRLLERVGIKIADNTYENIGFNRNLYEYAIDAYVQGVKDTANYKQK
jgi:hypothetical protein